MIEVHLIGYTADLKHLVLDVDANEERGRYRLVVDGDLFATLDDVRQQRWERGLDVGVWTPDDADPDDAQDDDAEDEDGWEDPAAAVEPALRPDDRPEPASWPGRGDESSDDDDLLLDLAGPTPEPEGATHALRPLDEHPDEELFERGDAGAGDPRLSALLETVAQPPDEDVPDQDEADDELDDEAPAVRVIPAPPLASRPAPPTSLDEGAAAVDRHDEDDDDEEDEDDWQDGDEAPVDEPTPARGRALDSDLPASLPSAPRPKVTKEGLEVPADARLSPAEIQAELRKGRSVRAVAREAGTDRAWVERWLQPIRAEQSRVVEQAWRLPVERRGTASALPLEEAVGVRLRRRNVDPEDATWDAVRRGDGSWRISCRFTEKGRQRTASWTWERGEDLLHPASELAREVGWVDRRLARQR